MKTVIIFSALMIAKLGNSMVVDTVQWPLPDSVSITIKAHGIDGFYLRNLSGGRDRSYSVPRWKEFTDITNIELVRNHNWRYVDSTNSFVHFFDFQDSINGNANIALKLDSIKQNVVSIMFEYNSFSPDGKMSMRRISISKLDFLKSGYMFNDMDITANANNFVYYNEWDEQDGYLYRVSESFAPDTILMSCFSSRSVVTKKSNPAITNVSYLPDAVIIYLSTSEKEHRIDLYSVVGSKIKELHAFNGQVVIPFVDLPAGIYFALSHTNTYKFAIR
jgi:hypothetical protein